MKIENSVKGLLWIFPRFIDEKFNRISIEFSIEHSQEALLVGGAGIPYNVDTVDTTSLRSSNRSPVSANETFWVPSGQRHSSTYGSEMVATTSAGKSH